MKFTEKTVAPLELPQGRSEVIFFDTAQPGFGLRLRAGGSRTWIYQFKVGTQHRRITLGNATVVSLQKAKAQAADLYAAVRLGRDPASEKDESRARASETFENELRGFLGRQRRRLRPSSYSGLERYLVHHCRSLHGLPLAKIDTPTATAAAHSRSCARRLGPIDL